VNKTIRIHNSTGAELYVSIEPIGEGYPLNPAEALSVTAEYELNDDGSIDIAIGPEDTVSVFVEEEAVVEKV
jgi:hypothetical protein